MRARGKDLLIAAGFNPVKLAAHYMRGAATSMMLALGASEGQTKHRGDWSSTSTAGFTHYVREVALPKPKAHYDAYAREAKLQYNTYTARVLCRRTAERARDRGSRMSLLSVALYVT